MDTNHDRPPSRASRNYHHNWTCSYEKLLQTFRLRRQPVLCLELRREISSWRKSFGMCKMQCHLYQTAVELLKLLNCLQKAALNVVDCTNLAWNVVKTWINSGQVISLQEKATAGKPKEGEPKAQSCHTVNLSLQLQYPNCEIIFIIFIN